MKLSLVENARAIPYSYWGAQEAEDAKQLLVGHNIVDGQGILTWKLRNI